MDSEEFNNMFGGDNPDEEAIALDVVIKATVPIFKGFVRNGLTPQEAAAMTAALISQGIPTPPPEPKED